MVLSKHIQDCFLNFALYFTSVFIHLKIMFWWCWVFAAVWAFCRCSKRALLSTCNAWAAHVVISPVAEFSL